jgi:hypothetical protein
MIAPFVNQVQPKAAGEILSQREKEIKTYRNITPQLYIPPVSPCTYPCTNIISFLHDSSNQQSKAARMRRLFSHEI